MLRLPARLRSFSATRRWIAAAFLGAAAIAAPRSAAAQLQLFTFDYTAFACAGAGCTPDAAPISLGGGAVTLTPWGATSSAGVWWSGQPLSMPMFAYMTFGFQDIGTTYSIAPTPITVALRFAPGSGVGDVFLSGILAASAGASSGSGELDMLGGPLTIGYATPIGYGSYTTDDLFDPGFYYARGYQASGSSTMFLAVARGTALTPGEPPRPQAPVTSTPEPATVALLGFGLLAFGIAATRTRS